MKKAIMFIITLSVLAFLLPVNAVHTSNTVKAAAVTPDDHPIYPPI